MPCLHGWNCISLPSIIQNLAFMRHRWFLERKHKYHKMKRHFDNTVEKDSAPKWYTRKLLFEMLKNIQVVFVKVTVMGQKRNKTPTLTDMPLKKQSNFFMYLPYLKDLATCHKNIFDNTIRTLLDMPWKMKDGLKSCNDLV
jgi:hypothetical protein